MDVSNLAVRILLEGAEASALSRAQLIAGLGLEDPLSARGRVRWDVFVTVMDRIFDGVGRAPEGLREVGRHMVRSPSFELVKVLARSLVSLRTLYEMGNKWVSRAFIPQVPLSVEFPAEQRVVFRGAVREPYAGSAPLFWLFEGCMCEVPRQLGLPRAVIEQSHVTARCIDTRIAYPRSTSLAERAIRAVSARVSAQGALQVLERQRRELEGGLEAMQRGSDELRGVLDQLPDLLVIHRDGVILWVNRALIETFGFDGPRGIVGKPLLSLIDEASVPTARSRLFSPPGEFSAPTEVHAVRRDGSRLTLELARPQLVLFGGAPAGLAVARDVGERVRMQQQLILADRLASLGVLAAGVAHEINNPLACALGGLEVATTELERHPAPQLRAALEMVSEGMGRVRTIVRDLRTLGQTDDGQIVAVDVNAALESTLTLVAKRLEHRARVERDYRTALRARANPARLGQVLLNLLLNAIDAVPEGSPLANVIRVATRDDADGRIVIEVSDSGPGIPPELVDRIFDPFFTTKPVGQGTGLGLAICQRILAELGGSISASSIVGVGTTLRLALPAADQTPSADVARANHEQPRSPRILIVDDERRLLTMLRMMLSTHDVTTASSVDEALARIAEEPAFDVILSDVMMPGRSGLDFFAELERTRPELCKRFVFMTGGTLSDDGRRIPPQARFLEKPFRGAELTAAVDAVLRDAASEGGTDAR